MILPPISEPCHYVGLYVYDFGSHVAVGYTAAELRILRESPDHRNGTAYEIYRVAENGGLELRGVTDDRIGAMETIGFLRAEADTAIKEYQLLLAVATAHPLPCPATMQRGILERGHLPHVTFLSFPMAASAALSAWLCEYGGDLGQQVIGGAEAAAALAGAQHTIAVSCRLPAVRDFADRAAHEVLAAVKDPLQR